MDIAVLDEAEAAVAHHVSPAVSFVLCLCEVTCSDGVFCNGSDRVTAQRTATAVVLRENGRARQQLIACCPCVACVSVSCQAPSCWLVEFVCRAGLHATTTTAARSTRVTSSSVRASMSSATRPRRSAAGRRCVVARAVFPSVRSIVSAAMMAGRLSDTPHCLHATG